MQEIRISARTLGLLNMPDACPRCFWIRLHCEEKFPFQIPMPGIFNSIDAYGKKIVHSCFDNQNTLPPWFPNIGDVQGFLSGSELHWSKFNLQHSETNIRLTGTPDDVFQMGDGSCHIIDYKTGRLTGTQDALSPLYEVQLNVYACIADSKGFSPISALSLIYMDPQTDVDFESLAGLMSDDKFHMNFRPLLRPVELKGKEFVLSLLEKARQIHDELSPPEGRDKCKDCQLLIQLVSVAQ